MKKLLESLQFRSDGPALDRLMGSLLAAQRERLSHRKSDQAKVTRSTALGVFAHEDREIRSSLEKLGFRWEKYFAEIGLERMPGSEPIPDVDIHDDFTEAITRYAHSQEAVLEVSRGTLAVAILEDARQNAGRDKRNSLEGRLPVFGLDFERLSKALNSRALPFDLRRRPPAPADEPTKLPETPGSSGKVQQPPGSTTSDLAADQPAKPPGTPGSSGEVQQAPDSTASDPAADQPAKPPETPGSSGEARDEVDTQFSPDDAERYRDDLGRGVLAIALARRLHRIWCQSNDAMPAEPTRDRRLANQQQDELPFVATLLERHFGPEEDDEPRAAFVVHVDSPWGGGKTTFANFLARVLNPTAFEDKDDSFLRRRYGPDANLETIFLQPDGREWPDAARRPWVIVPFSAWQAEHISPPWWVFYQTIRRRCFESVFREGMDAFKRERSGKDSRGSVTLQILRRVGPWLGLWWREIGWRLSNPKVTALLSTAGISLVLLLLFFAFGIVGLSSDGVGFSVANGVGLMLAALTAVGSVWGIGALVTESIRPGTDTLAERLSLGNGDPFERFRHHFHHTMLRVKRPVMVIIDDLDRCRPDFIVDLVRGIQTLLRSPRVVFLILGDRDWIERAFEAHHAAMGKVNVGPEQTLGARFVEKAIQMSFLLPGIAEGRQGDYVRRLLVGHRTRHGSPAAGMASVTAGKLSAAVVETLMNQKGGSVDTAEVRKHANLAFESLPADLKQGVTKKQVDQHVNEELAIHAASDEAVEREISHRLQSLAQYLPANPRQIKRIVNTVTMYHSIARQQIGLTENDALWFQLALWVTIMTEWPATWRLFQSYPGIIDLLRSEKPEEEIKSVKAALPPGLAATTLKLIARMQADIVLVNLVRGGKGRAGLTSEAVEELLVLTPLQGRSRSAVESAEPGT